MEVEVEAVEEKADFTSMLQLWSDYYDCPQDRKKSSFAHRFAGHQI